MNNIKTLAEVKFEIEDIKAANGNTWYAVIKCSDDNEHGTGSENIEEAYEIATGFASDTDFLAIVVVDDGDDFALAECIIKGDR